MASLDRAVSVDDWLSPDAGVLGELILDCGVLSGLCSGLGLWWASLFTVVIASCFFTAEIPSFVLFLRILGRGEALGLLTGVELGVLGACWAICGTVWGRDVAVYRLLATAATVAMELPLREFIGRAEKAGLVSVMEDMPVDPPSELVGTYCA